MTPPALLCTLPKSDTKNIFAIQFLISYLGREGVGYATSFTLLRKLYRNH